MVVEDTKPGGLPLVNVYEKMYSTLVTDELVKE
jgi:hypothetical protein